MKENKIDGHKSESTGKLMHRSAKSIKHEISKKMYDVKEMIDMHIDDMHSSVTDNAKETIKFVQSLQKTDAKLMKRQSEKKTKSIKLDPSLNTLKRLWDQVAAQDSDSSEFAVALKYHSDRPNKNDKDTNKKDSKSKNSKTKDSTKKPRLTLGEISSEENIRRADNLIDSKIERFRRASKATMKVITVCFIKSFYSKRAMQFTLDIHTFTQFVNTNL